MIVRDREGKKKKKNSAAASGQPWRAETTHRARGGAREEGREGLDCPGLAQPSMDARTTRQKKWPVRFRFAGPGHSQECDHALRCPPRRRTPIPASQRGVPKGGCRPRHTSQPEGILNRARSSLSVPWLGGEPEDQTLKHAPPRYLLQRTFLPKQPLALMMISAVTGPTIGPSRSFDPDATTPFDASQPVSCLVSFFFPARCAQSGPSPGRADCPSRAHGSMFRRPRC